jgi:hypothetical protein
MCSKLAEIGKSCEIKRIVKRRYIWYRKITAKEINLSMKDTTNSSKILCLHLVNYVHITVGFKLKHNAYSQTHIVVYLPCNMKRTTWTPTFEFSGHMILEDPETVKFVKNMAVRMKIIFGANVIVNFLWLWKIHNLQFFAMKRK